MPILRNLLRLLGKTPAEDADRAGWTCIGATVAVHGNMTGKGPVTISGRVEGDLSIEGDVRLLAGGRVEGTLICRRTSIGGWLTGGLVAGAEAVLEETGRIDGDVKAPRLSIEAGGLLNGHAAIGIDPEDSGGDTE